jgi:hypothetical protein
VVLRADRCCADAELEQDGCRPRMRPRLTGPGTPTGIRR